MSLKHLMLGVGVGFLAGAVLKDQLTKPLISPEKALRIVKRNLRNHGVIEGSWIHMIPEDYENNLLNYKIYRGGVSCKTGGDFTQFDFIVDGHTGAILDLAYQN